MQRQNGPSASQARRGSESTEESYTERAAGAAHEGVDILRDALEPGEELLREAAANAEEKLRGASAQARERAKDLAEQTREYVKENPLTAAAIAFAAGVIAISLIRR